MSTLRKEWYFKMVTTYLFDEKNRNFDGLMYAYSPVPKVHREFDLREDCVANYAGEDKDNFNYVSLITKKKYRGTVTVSAVCSFEGTGAPLIVISDDISKAADGHSIYGLHFEVVAYSGGCNIWRIVPAPEKVERPISTTRVAFDSFSIPENTPLDISVTIKGNMLTVCVNGNIFGCTHADIPEEFHVGITACEGPNKFYELIIEEEG